ncbi:hypothetical protein [Bradyrhizobium symbiodeficiens]|uniref:hypothetical protein n=1 Tax=Bradyrhizobium symbiodeficiens TaxID=1404367 RepID=UPI0011E4D4A1|nr:hypothetical protein [Bradyrhizobium symbiodeficiens]
MSLNPFNDLMFDIVQCLRIGRRVVLGTPFSSSLEQSQFVRHAIDAEIEKDISGWTVVMNRLAEEAKNAREG